MLSASPWSVRHKVAGGGIFKVCEFYSNADSGGFFEETDRRVGLPCGGI